MPEISEHPDGSPRMEWVIEALRVLREVRDWTRSRADTGVKRAERTHDAIEKATQRVEQVVGADPGTLVSPIGPASIPAIARTPTRNAERRSTRRDPPSRRHEIPIDQIDSHAISAVRRLRQHGYKAYLVGGCVRDLLLGLTPKDVDVSTDARPEEIKRVFRNSRIIGRRFRLVHLYYHGGKIIEVATFRANLTPDEDNVEEGQDLLVRRDNVFGTEEEDALRRDFTINGLFYDVHSGRIIDHVGGVEDVRQRYLRMIGDPEIRLREDPVRILRAVRFTAKANLRIDPELREAMRRHTSEVVRCAPARVLEETLKLLRTGQAAPSIRLMDELGLLEVLLPEIKAYLDGVGLDENDPEDALEQRSEALYAHLEALDDLVHLGQVSDVVILASLASAPLQAFLQEHDQQDPVKLIVDFLAVFAQRIALTRKLSESIRQALMMQRQLTRRTEPESGKRRRRRPPAPEALMSRGAFADALNLFDIQCHARELPMDEVEQWYDRVEEHVGQPVERPLDRAVLGPADDEERPRRRRRSRRRR